MGSDVYSYGIILWEIMTRKEVYAGLTAEQIIAKVANSDLRPTLTPNLPLRDVMASCWAHSAQARPSFSEIVQTLSLIYYDTKESPSLRGRRVTSRSSLDILETVEADGTTDEMRALVTDETPIRTPLVMSGAFYGVVPR